MQGVEGTEVAQLRSALSLCVPTIKWRKPPSTNTHRHAVTDSHFIKEFASSCSG